MKRNGMTRSAAAKAIVEVASELVAIRRSIQAATVSDVERAAMVAKWEESIAMFRKRCEMFGFSADGILEVTL